MQEWNIYPPEKKPRLFQLAAGGLPVVLVGLLDMTFRSMTRPTIVASLQYRVGSHCLQKKE